MGKVLALLLLTLCSQASTLFVGNGGEVYKFGQDYYVRDLVEMNIHKKPFFNCLILAPLDSKFDVEKLADLKLDHKLLAQKICDIDHVYPGFSKIFIASLNFHSWTLIDEELGLLPDDGPLFRFVDAERIQAANRTLFNIRIQSKTWNSLNPENKVALVIHEIIFSLLKFDCDDERCTTRRQSARLAREITGMLFNPSTYASREAKNKLQMLMIISFNNHKTVDMKEWMTPKTIRISVVSPDGRNLFVTEYPPNTNVEDFSNYVCSEYSRFDSDVALSVTVIDYQGFSLAPMMYYTTYGSESGIQIKQVRTLQMYSLKPLKATWDCLSKVKKAFFTF